MNRAALNVYSVDGWCGCLCGKRSGPLHKAWPFLEVDSLVSAALPLTYITSLMRTNMEVDGKAIGAMV